MFTFSLMLYPFLFLLAKSFSSEMAIASGSVSIFPREFNTRAYRLVFQSDELVRAYYNTVRYSLLSTVFHILISCIVAYPLAIRRFRRINKVVALYYVVTMFIGGGLIPTYLIYRGLGFIDSMWVMVIPGALSVGTLMIFKTYFQTMGMELMESANIDGANDFQILFFIMMPLSLPLIATFSLFQMVGKWNEFFTPMLFLNDHRLYPLTLLMRKLLIQLDITTMLNTMRRVDPDEIKRTVAPIEAFKAASIMVTVLPIMCIYPFIQKYFVKGIMIGSLKG